MTQKHNAEEIIAFVSSSPNATITDTQLHCDKLGISRSKFHEALNSRVCKGLVKRIIYPNRPEAIFLALKEVPAVITKKLPKNFGENKNAQMLKFITDNPNKTINEITAVCGNVIGGNRSTFSSMLYEARDKGRVFSQRKPDGREHVWATTPYPAVQYPKAAHPKAEKYIGQPKQGELTLNLLDTENINVAFMATRFMMGHQDDKVFKAFYIQAARDYFSKMQASLQKA